MINMKQYYYMLLEKFSLCDRKALYFFLEFSCHAMVVALCNRLPRNTLYYIVYRNELRFPIFLYFCHNCLKDKSLQDVWVRNDYQYVFNCRHRRRYFMTCDCLITTGFIMYF